MRPVIIYALVILGFFAGTVIMKKINEYKRVTAEEIEAELEAKFETKYATKFLEVCERAVDLSCNLAECSDMPIEKMQERICREYR